MERPRDFLTRGLVLFGSRPLPVDPAPVLVALQVLALWPLGPWYVARMTDGSDEPWGVLALLTALLLPSAAAREAGTLAVPSVAMLLYAAAFPFCPPLLRAALGFAALGTLWSLWRHGTPWHVPTLGLFLLALPWLASLQFYLGYPLRVAAGSLAVGLLRLSGFAVVREGVTLVWGSQSLLIDAPCSGVRMLWGGFYLTLVLCALNGLRARRCLGAVVLAAPVIVVGNGVRSAALFFTEARVITLPSWTHEGVGLAAFALVALALLALVRRLEVTPCPEASS